MPRHTLTPQERQRGGLTTATLPGGRCPRCGKTFPRHVQLAGHLGLHTFADRYAAGNMRLAAHKWLPLLGNASNDPAPWNGAYADGHRLAAQIAILKADPT